MMGIFCTPDSVLAKDPKPTIRDSAYSARFVSQSHSDPIIIEAGATKEVAVTFKNTGTKTWNGDSSRYVSAYTMEPRNRISPFLGKKQTPKIPGIVKSGEKGTLTLQLTAPKEVGEYVERFYLASENNTWMQNGYFFLKVTVIPKKVVVKEEVKKEETVPQEEGESVSENTPDIRAFRIAQSKKTVRVAGGDKIKMVVLYKNIGTESWKEHRLRSGMPTALAATDTLTFADKKWKNHTLVLASKKHVPVGSKTKKTFYFRAPEKKGEYTATFYLDNNGEQIDGSEAVVNVHVTENAPLNYTAPKFSTKHTVKKKEEVVRLAKEPRIRVGLTTVGNEVHFTALDEVYLVYDKDSLVGEVKKRVATVIRYVDGEYAIKSKNLDKKTQHYFRLVPKNNPHATFSVKRGLKDRRIAWVGSSHFQKYHGAFEYRVGEIDKELYIVNDVLLEDYTAGIAENGRHTSYEAVKANIVAARTYAYLSKGKYPFFDVLGSTYDQLYLGADVTDHLPQSRKAAKDTRGYMVTYRDEVVITPYFGNSSGHTRSWSSAWGGSHKPWLVPVKAKYDAGRRRFGHGVGMSQRDAALRAKNDNWDWKQLLAHYYSDTEATKIYK
ncbi:MAG: hypothetical protein HOL80_02630 [Candidatus Magasanikbacteria bacterium]|nr:hypothetical protein [Candidatus Magasanikbacteria bacterium]MBT5262771.1 hypothetical protein [Candidatus Magasanikbacteria bacterium]MBT5819845.1 hypothetical protein [Candidatus Magasanikbacteria bacterium]MBT6294747.1 hypothetical protein [Candidatus Magasanikbacteria bacterium]